uniref:Uncharacterized protein n=1 Tax=Oryza punctata TaxID=4537 RepID=A0A0E0K3M2_ORYPU
MSVLLYTITASTSVSGDCNDAREDAGDGSGDKRSRAKLLQEAACMALAVSSDGPGLLLFPGVVCTTTSLHASWTPKFSDQFLNRRGYDACDRSSGERSTHHGMANEGYPIKCHLG